MIDTLSAGDTITLTVDSVPRNKGAKDTIVRLMRRDPEIKRSLAHAQKLRRQRMHSYIRGGRRWFSRERAARIAMCERGNSWSMPFTYDIAPDLKSVEPYISISKS